MTDLEPLMNRRRLTVTLAFALPLGGLAAACAAYWVFGRAEEVSLADVDYSLEADGVRNPVMVPPRARLPENMPVVGVSINGRSRAYAIWALASDPTQHVVNDVIEGAPVTITYCDLNDCARVFTKADGSGAALDVKVGGLQKGKMVLIVGGRKFLQEAEDVPLDEVPFEHTTWKDWKAHHADSEVYIGWQRRDPGGGAMSAD